jgi:hypothetical protein
MQIPANTMIVVTTCLLTSCVISSNYTPPTAGPLASIRFETTERRVVNTQIRLYQNDECEQTALIGTLNSRNVGYRYSHSLETSLPAGQPLTISIFSALHRDVGVLDLMTQSPQTITSGLGYCETFIRFQPENGMHYQVIHNAHYRGCDMDIYKTEENGEWQLLETAQLDNNCHLKPLGNSQVYDGILTRDYSEF